MARDWESSFSGWARGPSDTEKEKANRAERQIRAAIEASEQLRTRNIRVFTQGSYRNHVNVRNDSDVDVGVLCLETFNKDFENIDIEEGISSSFEPAVYDYQTFKGELENALVDRFGRQAVSRGSKAFDIKENTYRVESDVAAFFEYRYYFGYDIYKDYLSGVAMFSGDDLERIVNWPEQHYTSGVEKNHRNNRRFKRVVRILKNLSNEMAGNGIGSANNTPSFLIECLVFNAQDECFNYSGFYPMVRHVLADTFNNTLYDDTCSDWVEVNNIKILFHPSQPWTRASAHQFLSDAWDYIGYS